MTVEMDVAEESSLAPVLRSIERRLSQANTIARYAELGPEKVLRFIHEDKLVRMFVPYANVDQIQAYVVEAMNFYEANALKKTARYIGRDSVVLDAGANIGNHMIYFAHILGAAKVISVEIMRQTFELLSRNVELNGLTNVTLHNVGLGATAGKADLFSQSLSNLGATTMRAGETGFYDLVTIDSLALDKVDFIKIDVEGMHLDVLAGARETLRRHRPYVWLELRPRAGEYEPGIEAMTKLGYRSIEQLSKNNFLFQAG